ncbi:MAG TPA: hypothetical protein VKB34_16970, partial [Povalibacter sp.]|nr:hypothetical protein [Povalibacter sp.]
MRSAPWIVSVLAALAPVALSMPAHADELAMPAAAPAAATNHPSRGMTMETVEATFGAPTNRVPAVGQPPITRWEYPGYV